MNILALHDGHNASACLLQDGVLSHAVQEERFTLMKNQGGFPRHSVDWIMQDAALDVESLDFVVLSSWRNPGPSYTRAEIVQSYIRQAQMPQIWKFQLRTLLQSFLKKMGLYEKVKMNYDKARLSGVTQNLSGLPHKKIAVLDHHLCHASSAFYGGPWAKEKALVLTLDGSGDGRCATVYVGSEGQLRLVASTPVGHSLGDIYSYTTHLMGFVPLEHEYKLMGMAPYADQERAEEISNIFESYVEVDGLVFKRRIREPTFFIGKRLREDLKYVRFDLIAAGLQLFTERTILKWVRNTIDHTKIRKLCLAGGVFMNVKVNGLIAQLDEVENIFICPSCGDESLSIGAAYEWYAQVHNYKRLGEPLKELYLGPTIDESELALLASKNSDLKWEKPGNVTLRVAELLAQGEIVARCEGRTEFGSRALGNRSIFADPSNPFVVHMLNKMIKMRDFWMPFAPIVREDRQERYLVNPKAIESPYMMLAFDTYPARFKEVIGALQPCDRSSRPEILKMGYNPEVEDLLRVFESLTGRSVLLNTSYNIHGEPMVSSAERSLDVLRRSGLKWLWLGSYLVSKKCMDGDDE